MLGLGKSGKRYRALRSLSQRANLLLSSGHLLRGLRRGDPIALCQASCSRRKRLPLADLGRRTSGPASESMVERGRLLVTQLPSDLGKRDMPGSLRYWSARLHRQLVYDLLVCCLLDSQPARKRSRAHGERFCYGSLLRLAMRQELFPLRSRPRRARVFDARVAENGVSRPGLINCNASRSFLRHPCGTCEWRAVHCLWSFPHRLLAVLGTALHRVYCGTSSGVNWTEALGEVLGIVGKVLRRSSPQRDGERLIWLERTTCPKSVRCRERQMEEDPAPPRS